MHSTTDTENHGAADTAFLAHSLYEALQRLPDARHKRGRRYEVGLVLTLLLLAKLAGESTMAAIAQWVQERQMLLAQWLPLPRCPCANTYRNICAGMDADVLLQAVAGVLNAATVSALAAQAAAPQAAAPQAAAPQAATAQAAAVQAAAAQAAAAPPLRHLACDGKALRGSHRLTVQGVQAAQELFGVYDTHSGCMEALLPIAGKGFEAKAFRAWLARQPAQGASASTLLTADALHTQTAVCKAIRKAGADYLLVAKRNQRQLCEDIAYLFSQPPDFWFAERSVRTVTQGHGRLEVRILRASSELNAYLADRWPGVQQVFQIERIITRRSRQGTKTTVERVYGLTSLSAAQATPVQLLAWVREHWAIENRSHWRRDATLGEDRLQLASKPAVRVMAVLNCLILALFDRMGCTNCRKAMRTFNAHPEQALALLRRTYDF